MGNGCTLPDKGSRVQVKNFPSPTYGYEGSHRGVPAPPDPSVSTRRPGSRTTLETLDSRQRSWGGCPRGRGSFRVDDPPSRDRPHCVGLTDLGRFDFVSLPTVKSPGGTPTPWYPFGPCQKTHGSGIDRSRGLILNSGSTLLPQGTEVRRVLVSGEWKLTSIFLGGCLNSKWNLFTSIKTSPLPCPLSRRLTSVLYNPSDTPRCTLSVVLRRGGTHGVGRQHR